MKALGEGRLEDLFMDGVEVRGDGGHEIAPARFHLPDADCLAISSYGNRRETAVGPSGRHMDIVCRGRDAIRQGGVEDAESL